MVRHTGTINYKQIGGEHRLFQEAQHIVYFCGKSLFLYYIELRFVILKSEWENFHQYQLYHNEQFYRFYYLFSNLILMSAKRIIRS